MIDKWTKRFLELATHISTWSTCKRRQCGAIIVKNKRVLSTGYNGAPAGCLECINVEGECLRSQLGIPSGQRSEICRATHAEQNAIVSAARHGIAIDGASIYITTQPCVTCAKMIINAGIKEVHYIGDYPDQLSLDLLEEANVLLYKYDVDL